MVNASVTSPLLIGVSHLRRLLCMVHIGSKPYMWLAGDDAAERHCILWGRARVTMTQSRWCMPCFSLLSYPIRVMTQYLARQCSRVLALVNHYHPVDDYRRNPCSVLMRVVKRGPIRDLLGVKDGEVSAVALTQETTV